MQVSPREDHIIHMFCTRLLAQRAFALGVRLVASSRAPRVTALPCVPRRRWLTTATTSSAPQHTDAKPRTSGTVDAAEINKFVQMAAEWWSIDGKFAPLHAQNPTRVSFIREQLRVGVCTVSWCLEWELSSSLFLLLHTVSLPVQSPTLAAKTWYNRSPASR